MKACSESSGTAKLGETHRQGRCYHGMVLLRAIVKHPDCVKVRATLKIVSAIARGRETWIDDHSIPAKQCINLTDLDDYLNTWQSPGSHRHAVGRHFVAIAIQPAQAVFGARCLQQLFLHSVRRP